MKSFMPGECGWTDHGPRIMSYFDRTWNIGRLPMWVRDIGYDEKGTFHTSNGYQHEGRPVGFNRSAKEEPYINALKAFFGDKIDLMPPKPRQVLSDVKDWLHSIMHDIRSTRDIAKDLGFKDHTAVVKARGRAVDQLVESIGGKAATAEKLRQFLFDLETQDGLDRLKYLPRWVHG